MAYNELVKKFEKIRDYMRGFYVYGFWSRDQYDMKSARSYDNERRRVESWMGDYASFRQEVSGKVIFLSVDGRAVPHNPLYNAFKAKSFTANDITLHFYLMDILEDGEALSIKEILEKIVDEYFLGLCLPHEMDESTLRKKLKEYETIGLVKRVKDGRNLLYQRGQTEINLETWAEILAFFSETDSLGVIGSFLLDKLTEIPDYYRFKHHFLLYALDSEVLCRLLDAMNEQADVRLKIRTMRGQYSEFTVHPMKIYVSTQNGRQYLLAWDDRKDRPWFYRLDNITEVKKEDVTPERRTPARAASLHTAAANKDDRNRIYEEKYENIKNKLWGVSLGDYTTIEHLEMIVHVEEYEYFIVQRLEREKRCGSVEKIDENRYRFSIDVFDTKEMLPWIRTFIGRIISFECSNSEVKAIFYRDLQNLYVRYNDRFEVAQTDKDRMEEKSPDKNEAEVKTEKNIITENGQEGESSVIQ